MERKIIVGVMGPSEKATAKDNQNAFELGKCIAKQGWVLLTGGRDSGVMNSACKGAKLENGLTIGILPDEDHMGVSEYVDVPILTGMGSARNNINVLTSDVIVVCGMGAGTLSEIALAIKAEKSVILLSDDDDFVELIKKIGKRHIYTIQNPADCVKIVKKLIVI